jgi:predicted transcriptional regulator
LIDQNHLDPADMRLTIAKRQETAKALVNGGMSQRQAAKVLGVNQKTVSNDLKNFSSKSEEKLLIEERNAELKLVEVIPPEKT